MKKHFVLNRRTMSREFVVLPQRGERLNTQRAKWLGETQQNVLLRFECEMGRNGEKAVLHYDVHGLVSLKSYLKREVLDDVGFVRLLVSVQEVMDTCAANKIPTELIQFDTQHVFVDNQAQSRFVVIPLDDMPFEVENSPLTMLKALGNTRRLSFSSPYAEALSSRLEAFVLTQNNVFSANAYRAFLRDQCDVGQPSRSSKSNSFTYRESGTRDDGDTVVRVWSPVDRDGSKNQTFDANAYCLERISTGESYSFSEAREMRIGRGSKNDVQLTGNPKLSRTHALIRCMGSNVSIIDLGSANGTWVNGVRLDPERGKTIPLGQRFSLANEELVVRHS